MDATGQGAYDTSYTPSPYDGPAGIRGLPHHITRTTLHRARGCIRIIQRLCHQQWTINSYGKSIFSCCLNRGKGAVVIEGRPGAVATLIPPSPKNLNNLMIVNRFKHMEKMKARTPSPPTLKDILLEHIFGGWGNGRSRANK